MRHEQLSKPDAIAAVETGVPTLGAVRNLLERFHQILRPRNAEALTSWLVDTGGSLLASLAKRIARNLTADRAAITDSGRTGAVARIRKTLTNNFEYKYKASLSCGVCCFWLPPRQDVVLD